MLWIYGGGFFMGGFVVGLYNGGYFVIEGEVMVVIFNYCVGVLGFLFIGIKEIFGNFGFLD